MTNAEIEVIIAKYELFRKGDRLGTYKANVNREEFFREVGGNKAEILAYMMGQEQAEDELSARRQETFDAIPGVKEIRQARQDNAAWRRELNRMMDAGDGVMNPGFVRHTDDEMSELEAKYPQAVKALEIQYRASVTENVEMSAIYTRAYDAIQDGADVDDTYAAMEEELKAYTDRHIWD